MIKAIFFDADGTLISHAQKAVPESARRAIAALQAKGIRCILATGRHITEVNALPVRDIPFDGYITVNGQVCLDEQQQLLCSCPIVGEARERILQLFREKEITIALKEQDRMYVNQVTKRLRSVMADISTAVPAVGENSGAPIYQAVFFLTKEEESLLEELRPLTAMTRWHPSGIDLMDPSGGKVEGIREYLRRSGIREEETMAFGDGENDIGMLRFAAVGVAMGNAPDEVKTAADYVTEDVESDGIARALRRFDLL